MNELEKSEDSDAISEAYSTTSKPHVEFKEPGIVAPEEPLPPTAVNKVCFCIFFLL